MGKDNRQMKTIRKQGYFLISNKQNSDQKALNVKKKKIQFIILFKITQADKISLAACAKLNLVYFKNVSKI